MVEPSFYGPTITIPTIYQPSWTITRHWDQFEIVPDVIFAGGTSDGLRISGIRIMGEFWIFSNFFFSQTNIKYIQKKYQEKKIRESIAKFLVCILAIGHD